MAPGPCGPDHGALAQAQRPVARGPCSDSPSFSGSCRWMPGKTWGWGVGGPACSLPGHLLQRRGWTRGQLSARPGTWLELFLPTGSSSDNGPFPGARRHNHGKFWVKPGSVPHVPARTHTTSRVKGKRTRGRWLRGWSPEGTERRAPRLTCTSPARARSSCRRSGARCPRPARPGARG